MSAPWYPLLLTGPSAHLSPLSPTRLGKTLTIPTWLEQNSPTGLHFWSESSGKKLCRIQQWQEKFHQAQGMKRMTLLLPPLDFFDTQRKTYFLFTLILLQTQMGTICSHTAPPRPSLTSFNWATYSPLSPPSHRFLLSSRRETPTTTHPLQTH